MLSTFGLFLIVVGWLIQAQNTVATKRGQDIQPAFVLLYIAGVVMLILGGLLSSGVSVAVLLNVAAGILAALVWYRLSR